ncbi:MAG: DUF58 domain-containing protein [Euryarchaeota archaeon]|nr:DUF58 domain-containing protein [Euryarchaeota archaeon]
MAIALGVFLGNPPVMLFGFTLLVGALAAAAPATLKTPKVGRSIRVTRTTQATTFDEESAELEGLELSKPGRRATVGEEIAVEWDVSAGPGLALVHDDLPAHVELTHGTNFRLHDCDTGPLTSSYRFRATRRGACDVPPTQVYRFHPFGLDESTGSPVGETETIEVEDSTAEVLRMKRMRARGKTTTPDEDRITQGVKTTDFREIRQYSMGDPLKIINWRATAKRSTGPRLELMVNEYEIEGKRAAWFFLDAGAYMEVGTNALNLLDFSADAALGLVSYLSERNFRVGGTIYNAAEPVVFYPDTGRRQSMKVRDALAKLRPAATADGLPVAVERVKGFLAREKPVVFVLSRVECAYEMNVEGVRRIRSYAGSRASRAAPIVWLSPTVDSTVEESDEASGMALAILGYDAQRKARALRRLGVSLLQWDPFEEPVGSALMRGIER